MDFLDDEIVFFIVVEIFPMGMQGPSISTIDYSTTIKWKPFTGPPNSTGNAKPFHRNPKKHISTSYTHTFT